MLATSGSAANSSIRHSAGSRIPDIDRSASSDASAIVGGRGADPADWLSAAWPRPVGEQSTANARVVTKAEQVEAGQVEAGQIEGHATHRRKGMGHVRARSENGNAVMGGRTDDSGAGGAIDGPGGRRAGPGKRRAGQTTGRADDDRPIAAARQSPFGVRCGQPSFLS